MGPKRGKVKKVLVFKAKLKGPRARGELAGMRIDRRIYPRGGFRRGKEDYNKKKTKEMKKIIRQ